VLATLVLAALLAELATPLYLGATWLAARRAPPPPVEPATWPRVTVVLATYREAETVERRLADLDEHDYAPFDVLVVDSASPDGTAGKARAFRPLRHRVRVLEQPERLGKAAALREALALADAPLVCLTDADCAWAPGALRAAVARILEPGVGAVTGAQELLPGEGAARAAEEAYARAYATMRAGESALGSTPVFRGELALFRREALDAASVGDLAPLADDSELALKARRAGWRAVVEPTARFREHAPPTLDARRRQKSRRGAGLLQLFARAGLPMAMQPWRYGAYSFILAANLAMLLAAPAATLVLAVALPLLSWKLAALAAGLAIALPRTSLSLLQSHVALLQAIPLALRGDGRWEPIAEVRALWRASPR
jgi:cellulose synthase/poly-beta-1,6-N-acetylglucosamine synthase-like glycosyltransferase